MTGKESLVEEYALAYLAWLETKEPDEVRKSAFNMCRMWAKSLTEMQLTAGIYNFKRKVKDA